MRSDDWDEMNTHNSPNLIFCGKSPTASKEFFESEMTPPAPSDFDIQKSFQYAKTHFTTEGR